MLARDWVIVLVLFGLITGIGFMIVADIASDESGYDVANMTDEDYRDKYNTFTNSSLDIYKMQNATASGEGLSIFSTYTTFFKSTFNVIGIVFGGFGMAINAMKSFGNDLGMPSNLVNLIFGAIAVIIFATIIFVIISSVSRGRL